MKNRNLTASLHTVSAVTRVALHLNKIGGSDRYNNAPVLTSIALDVLGYMADQYADEKGRALFAACLVSVRRAISGGAK